jgi:hypothetical protein
MDLNLNTKPGKISMYDPWINQWKDIIPIHEDIVLPEFKRSLVIRINLNIVRVDIEIQS